MSFCSFFPQEKMVRIKIVRKGIFVRSRRHHHSNINRSCNILEEVHSLLKLEKKKELPGLTDLLLLLQIPVGVHDKY